MYIRDDTSTQTCTYTASNIYNIWYVERAAKPHEPKKITKSATGKMSSVTWKHTAFSIQIFRLRIVPKLQI